jgi:hypothetical protein
MEDTEYFMVTVVDDMGNEMIAYVTSKEKHQYVQMMSSEYGNVQIEQVEFEDLPQDVVKMMQQDK